MSAIRTFKWLLLCLVSVTAAVAQQAADTSAIPEVARKTPRFEVGVALGEPTGGTIKFWFTPRNAVDFLAGVSFVPDAKAHLQLDYLRHDFRFTRDVADGTMPIVYGLGAYVQFRDDFVLGFRVPVGLAYLFNEYPFSLFLRVSPTIEVLPDFDVGLASSVGVRYVF